MMVATTPAAGAWACPCRWAAARFLSEPPIPFRTARGQPARCASSGAARGAAGQAAQQPLVDAWDCSCQAGPWPSRWSLPWQARPGCRTGLRSNAVKGVQLRLRDGLNGGPEGRGVATPSPTLQPSTGQGMTVTGPWEPTPIDLAQPCKSGAEVSWVQQLVQELRRRRNASRCLGRERSLTPAARKEQALGGRCDRVPQKPAPESGGFPGECATPLRKGLSRPAEYASHEQRLNRAPRPLAVQDGGAPRRAGPCAHRQPPDRRCRTSCRPTFRPRTRQTRTSTRILAMRCHRLATRRTSVTAPWRLGLAGRRPRTPKPPARSAWTPSGSSSRQKRVCRQSGPGLRRPRIGPH